MTKQDVELIADVVRNRFRDHPVATRALAVAFADALQSTNPRFNGSRFIAACMGEDSTDSAGRRVRYS